MREAFNTPWKLWNELLRWLVLPLVRFSFFINRIPWKGDYRFYGLPIIQKHRQSCILIGSGLGLRSTVRSNPLGPYHPVTLCTWKSGAVLEIGAKFSMSGGTICSAQKITIGNNVVIGANTTIIDTDFHPLDPQGRFFHPQEAKTIPVQIDDDVFIGMNCVILKGVHLGQGCVIGAGSVVSRDVPAGMIAAGNPAKIIGATSPG
jgi:acetyltransferase-like isoleucine patch superfamily enzyme